ncbi:MAG: glycosyltransferase [Erysipelotrichaceae bacterium]|nr:glycosyltransferase [Erysipelotrichaceae bacterium]
MNRELTVIVPVYNGERDLQKCLDSLFAVTLPVRIMVVDDGSTDGTIAILKKANEEHAELSWFSKANEGIASARNYAVDRVETEYFTFLDADDTVEPEVYEKLLKKMKEEGSDIGFSDFLWVYEDGSTRPASDTGYTNKHELLEKMFATLWNKIYRTEWFRKTEIRFPDGLKYEDASLLYRLVLYMDHISYLPEVSVNYLQRSGSITHTFDIHINDMIRVFEGIKEYYQEKGQYEEYRDEIEYLFIRFFLGNSYLRAVRIEDKKLKEETLHRGYDFLTTHYPDYRKNPYLKKPGKKNLYFRHLSRPLYFLNAQIFPLLYKIGVMK